MPYKLLCKEEHFQFPLVSLTQEKIPKHPILTITAPCTILSLLHYTSQLLSRLRATAYAANPLEEEIQDSFMQTIWST